MAPDAIHIVDDDASVRDSLSLLLSLRGYAVTAFSCAEDFLSILTPQLRGCLIADIRMPGMSGLALLQRLRASGSALAVVMITAHGDVHAARQAFLAEAVDFLEKPFDESVLLAAVQRALDRSHPSGNAAKAASAAAWAQLTPREQAVVDLVVAGQHNKVIGMRLKISPRTVEVHRARAMSKLGVRNVVELVQLAERVKRGS